MKRLRFLSDFGNGSAIIPGGQILLIWMVPGLASEAQAGGSWLQIAESRPIWVPPSVSFSGITLRAEDLGLSDRSEPITDPCDDPHCDQWPGTTQVEIIFGQNVQRPPRLITVDGTPVPDIGTAPQSWLVIYNGNP